MSWPPLRRYAVRARVAALAGVVALLASAAVGTMILLATDRAIRKQVPAVDVSVPARETEAQAETLKNRTIAEQDRIQRQYYETVHAAVVRRSLLTGGAAVAGALVLGWFVAGSTMRPLAVITACARRVAAGNLGERVGLGRRRDEWGELADATDAMLNRLEETFATQSRFVGNASHELKTPLAINRTLIEVAMARPDASADLLKLGENLLAVNDRHERLVDGMLTLARAEHRVLTPAPVNLAETVEEALLLVYPEAHRNGVSIGRSLDAVVVEADAVLLDRLVQNLAQNAVRHNEPGGWVQVEVAEADGHARLVVANSGPVVPPGAVPELFNPFTRLGGRVRSGRGTGLGLSIARAIVQAHDGTVQASARSGGGLVVEVKLRRQEITE
ncbi:HAMP domain-containing histidine kinase [Actinoplanes sp. KI2]|uniref:sensor histidine kinase n=1 Tax=Actinoplanes sp. KI2 TaxID=2983315 RepID=UPI0021D5BC5D|nr:HAMP domain-containing sensor histidine kinase [Actinoplanes sp. KI2]MCU7723031.1 HAMP domain-containing histidine kinase [Actinoplanes sp. KI2]